MPTPEQEDLDDEREFYNQVETIGEWAKSTVSVVIALYEPHLQEHELDGRVEEASEIIKHRIIGNHGHFEIRTDDDLKMMYKRVVEATLRWSLEKAFQ